MLLLFKEEGFEGSLAYYIVPSDKKVFFISPNSLVISPESVRDKRGRNPIPPGVDLGYVDGKKTASIKTDKDSRLLILPNRIEFNGLEGKPIVVTW